MCIPRGQSDVNKHKYTCTRLSCASWLEYTVWYLWLHSHNLLFWGIHQLIHSTFKHNLHFFCSLLVHSFVPPFTHISISYMPIHSSIHSFFHPFSLWWGYTRLNCGNCGPIHSQQSLSDAELSFHPSTFLAATKQLYKWYLRLSVRLSVCPSVCLSVTPFWLCSHHRIIMKFSGVIINDQSKVHANGQGQRSKVKVTEVTTQLNRFRTVTPVWIPIWW